MHLLIERRDAASNKGAAIMRSVLEQLGATG
jgi:hypothetical protein